MKEKKKQENKNKSIVILIVIESAHEISIHFSRDQWSMILQKKELERKHAHIRMGKNHAIKVIILLSIVNGRCDSLTN